LKDIIEKFNNIILAVNKEGIIIEKNILVKQIIKMIR
jgi:hypothetical protein